MNALSDAVNRFEAYALLANGIVIVGDFLCAFADGTDSFYVVAVEAILIGINVEIFVREREGQARGFSPSCC